jgi:hypothetical protein
MTNTIRNTLFWLVVLVVAVTVAGAFSVYNYHSEIYWAHMLGAKNYNPTFWQWLNGAEPRF